MQDDPSPEPEQATIPGADPPKAERSDTTYVILQKTAAQIDGPWLIASEFFQARSAEAAVRAYGEGMKADNLSAAGVTLVAIPARSWRPVKVTTKVETTLVIEDL